MNVSEIIEDWLGGVSPVDLVLCLTGSVLLGCWLLRTSLGTRALIGSPTRRNNMPLFLPFLLLFASYFFVALSNSILMWLLPDLSNTQEVILGNLNICLSSLVMIVIILILVRHFFARGLKGFGLNIKAFLYTCIFILFVPGIVAVIILCARAHFTPRLRRILQNIIDVLKDFFYAFVNLLTMWPLIMLAFAVTVYLGRFFYGPDFQMQKHQALETISEHPQLLLRILVTVVAVLVAPVLEELLFRGLFQTAIRSVLYTKKHAPWLAIAISSGLFVMMHIDLSHWPALYVLGVGMGYSYEKSGSLFRPMFMHILFNATSVVSVWVQ
jgi:membrane protease YdiL (CAAX protease family)